MATFNKNFKVKNGLEVTNQIISTLATGTSPFSVTSTTVNTNLNADLLDGQHGSYYTTAGNLSGTIPSSVLGNSTVYIGSTAIALNRASASQSLTGITSIDGSAATLTTSRTIGDVSFNGSANIVPERINYKDTRAVNYNPFTYIGTTLHLKTNTTDSLSDGGTYHGVLDLAHWSDSSGGVNHQLGLTDNGHLWMRYSTGASTWSTWARYPDTTDNLSVFASTTSAQLAGVISDETGTGSLVFSASPTFTGTINAANLTLSGDLTVNGTTTNINTTNLVVEDKNIVIGDVATPSDTTADGGGITLKGATDKTFNWINSTGFWTSSVGLSAPRLISTVASGTAPLTVTSNTLVSNLNADLLDGNEASAFALLSGSTFTGKITTFTSTSGSASLTIPHGVAPTAPVNGDVWTTTAGMYARVNGSTVGPFGTAGGGGVTYTFNSTAPSSPNAGDIWIDADTGIKYTYVNDSNSSAWVEMSSMGFYVPPSSIAIANNTTNASYYPLFATATGTSASTIYTTSSLFIVNPSIGAMTLGSSSSTLGAGSVTHQFGVVSAAAANIGVVVRGAASQTGNLQEWQNSSGTALLAINSSGSIITPATNATSTNSTGITIQTGNATGTTSTAGSITIDSGTGTTAAGSITIGGTNATGVTIGRNSGTTTIAAPTVTLSNATTLNINGANPSIATSQTTGTSNILTGFNGTINIGSSTSTVTIGNTLSSTGAILAPAATTSIPSIRLPHGTAPSSPTNGDVWTTTAGMYVRVNGATVGPLGAGGGGSVTPSDITGGTTGQAIVSNGTNGAWTTLTMENIPDAAFKKSVIAATVGSNITLSGGAPNTLDGITLALNDRILVKDQTTASQNGIYYVSTLGTGSNGTWTRVVDGDTASEIAGATVVVDKGTGNGGLMFRSTFESTDTLGTTSMYWYPIVNTGFYTLSANRSISSNTSAQSIFGVAFSVNASTTYMFEGMVILNTGTTGHHVSFNMAAGGSATLTSSFVRSTFIDAVAASGTTTSASVRGAWTNNVLTAFYMTNGTSTTTQKSFYVKGILTVNAAGTLTPQITFSVAPGGTNTVGTGSWFTFTPLGHSSTNKIGPWA